MSNDQIIAGFVENVNTRRLIFISLFEVEDRSLRIQLRENPVKLDKLNKLEKLQSTLMCKVARILFSSDVFLGVTVIVT